MQAHDILEFFNNHPLLQNDPSHRNDEDEEPIDDIEEHEDPIAQDLNDAPYFDVNRRLNPNIWLVMNCSIATLTLQVSFHYYQVPG